MRNQFRSTSWRLHSLGLMSLIALYLSGCGLGARQVVMQEEDYAARLATDPIVEVMIEYSAPAADFAATPSFTLQVNAREGNLAEAKLFHGLWNEVVGTPPVETTPSIDGVGMGRGPASVVSTLHGSGGGMKVPQSSWQLEAGKIRDEMKDLALSGREPAAAFVGCAFQ